MQNNFVCPSCRGTTLSEIDCCSGQTACKACDGFGLNASMLDLDSLRTALNEFTSKHIAVAPLVIDGSFMGWAAGNERLELTRFLRKA